MYRYQSSTGQIRDHKSPILDMQKSMEHMTFYYSLRHDQKIAVAPLHAPMLFFLPSQQVVMSNSFSFIELVAFFSSAEFYCSGSQTAAPG